MSQQPILRARQPQQALVPTERVGLSERMAEAQALSKAGDLIPAAYRNNPGGCMLVMDWAERHDVALFDAMGHVAFFNGKTSVEARLQRQMAARSGYYTRVTGEGAEPGEEFCTVGVYDSNGALIGEYTMTHDKAKLLDVYSRNPNYKKALDQMLLARATTRALDRYATAPTLIGVFVDEEDEPDPVDVLRAPMAEPAPPPAAVEVIVTEDIVEAELVEDVEAEMTADVDVMDWAPRTMDSMKVAATIDTGWTVDSLKVALKSAGLTQAQALMASHKATLVELCKDSDAVAKLLDPHPSDTMTRTQLEEPF